MLHDENINRKENGIQQQTTRDISGPDTPHSDPVYSVLETEDEICTAL